MIEVEFNDSLLCYGRCFYFKWFVELISLKVVIGFMECMLFLWCLLKFNN